MADIRGLGQDQAIIRAELDQLKAEIWPVLQRHGEEWVDRFDQMIRAFGDHDEEPWRSVGIIAQIGFLHLLESWTEPPIAYPERPDTGC